MFKQTKDMRDAQVSLSTRPYESTRPPERGRRRARARRRLVVFSIVVAGACTVAVFGVGVTAQTRAESRVVELDERITLLQLRLQNYLEQVDELTARAEERRAENDDARAALDSTEGFLE